MKAQRDIFLEEIYYKLKTNKDIYVMSADFGAPALDSIRRDFEENFIHCGISEQAMFDIGTGLSLEGKSVFTYAMAPFISLRTIEQLKCGPAMMNLPMNIISVGIGLGYADAGPTHYSTEDFACLRAISGTKIYTASDNFITSQIAKETINKNNLNYIRLDRHPTDDIDFDKNQFNFENGFRIIGEYSDKKVAIISHGRILHNCLMTLKKNHDKCFLVDIFCSKPISNNLIEKLKDIKKILVMDEQTPNGNLTSAIQEKLSENKIFNYIQNLSLPESYIFQNGGRDYLLKSYNLDDKSILETFDKII